MRDAWIFGVNPSFWSLATEWQLYLLYPVLWVVRARFGSRGMLTFAFLVSFSIRVAAELRYPHEPPMWIAMAALTLWFDWTLGAYLCDAYAVAEVMRSIKRKRRRHPEGHRRRNITAIVVTVNRLQANVVITRREPRSCGGK